MDDQKLNEDKANIIYMVLPYYSKSVKHPIPKLVIPLYQPYWFITKLRIICDKFIHMNDNVTSVCTAEYYHFKNIHNLKPFLS